MVCSRGVMEDKRGLFAVDELRWGSCRFGCHEHTAVGGEVSGSESGTNGRMHWHVGVVRDESRMRTDAWMHRYHSLLLHELCHSQLVSLLCPSPLGSAVLEPYLQSEQNQQHYINLSFNNKKLMLQQSPFYRLQQHIIAYSWCLFI